MSDIIYFEEWSVFKANSVCILCKKTLMCAHIHIMRHCCNDLYRHATWTSELVCTLFFNCQWQICEVKKEEIS